MLLEVYNRWTQANRLLRPVVDALPHFLVLAVGLFIIGLLDSLLSSSLPISPVSVPILGAAVSSSILVGLSGTIIVFSVVHGCIYPSMSPFQSLLSSFINNRAQFVFSVSFRAPSHLLDMTTSWTLVGAVTVFYKHIISSIAIALSHIRTWITTRPAVTFLDATYPLPHDPDVSGSSALVQDAHVDLLADDIELILPATIEIYHKTLIHTHDDDSVDCATAALWDTVRPSLPGWKDAPLQSKRSVIETLIYLLSPECSRRANLTAALTVIRIEGMRSLRLSFHQIKLM